MYHSLVESPLHHIDQYQCARQGEGTDATEYDHFANATTLRIVSVCSASHDIEKTLIPQIVASHRKAYNLGSTGAIVIHGVPAHKLVVNNPVSEVSRDSWQPQLKSPAMKNVERLIEDSVSESPSSLVNASMDVPALLNPLVNQRLTPPQVVPGLNGSSIGDDLKDNSSCKHDESTTVGDSTEKNATKNDEQLLFHMYTFLPVRTATAPSSFPYIIEGDRPMVPPNSMHYSINIHTMPAHTVPPFESTAKLRYKELVKGGCLLLVYPTSLSLYFDTVIPCLDHALLQLLGLNMISSQTCEALTTPPNASNFPSYDAQLEILQSLPGAQIIHSEHILQFAFPEWSNMWMHEDLEWLKRLMQHTEVHAGQILLKMVQGMAASELWHSATSSQVAVFVVKKSSFID